MKNSILPATVMLYISLWSIGISGHLGVSKISYNTGFDSGLVIPGSETRVITRIFFIDQFMSLPHPSETILEYGNTIKTHSLNLMHDIWTKGIKGPFISEYEYLTNLGKTVSESMQLESLFHKTIELAAKLSGQLLASS